MNPENDNRLRSLELFAGAGGLGLGQAMTGFHPTNVIEWDKWACDTIRENQERGFPLVSDWRLFEGDARAFDYASIPEGIDLVSGGPPCQPFSIGGKHKANSDARDMFPTAISAVRQIRPKAFIFENVKGITRAKFANYFQYIVLQLTFPEIVRKSDESWLDHLGRLEKEKTGGKRVGLTYNVVWRVLNAADYGVPQTRERVFIVGFRNDLDAAWSFPDATHARDSLLFDQWVAGDYWERHSISKRKRPMFPERFKKRIELLSSMGKPSASPWVTVRDALRGLPHPRNTRMMGEFHNHRFRDGAKVYPGHTGSPLDSPAKTLKAGAHGVPGGENMMVLDDGTVRYFTVRESARLQTFPDEYVFHGSWTESM